MVRNRPITRDDIIPIEQYAASRREARRAITILKKNRRVEVGPFVTFYFENYATMWHQVHEMLHIERGGEEQIADELAAYNPLIPNGNELTATVMLEIDDPTRRAQVLSRLGGVENHMFLSFGHERIQGLPDPTRENTSPEGKASAVQFMRFPFTEAQKAAFRKSGTQILLGIDHPDYGHIAVMPDPARRALADDFA
ncbi:MAG TPA: DUF3501 family protein [Stellaceae bacterium]|nr:DUF3501 family protein [Stellaceae bacterium]